jgi:hypothetical protein
MNYPKKKKRKQNSFQQKENSDRIYYISRLKKYRIMSEIFRNRLRIYDKMSDIVAGLINYRIMNQQN